MTCWLRITQFCSPQNSWISSKEILSFWFWLIIKIFQRFPLNIICILCTLIKKKKSVNGTNKLNCIGKQRIVLIKFIRSNYSKMNIFVVWTLVPHSNSRNLIMLFIRLILKIMYSYALLPFIQNKRKNSAMLWPCGKTQNAFLNMKASQCPGCDNVL